MTGHLDERTLLSFAERGIKTIIRNRAWLREHGISYDTLGTAIEGNTVGTGSERSQSEGSEMVTFDQQAACDEIKRGEVALVYALEMLETADRAFHSARTLADNAERP